MAKTKQKIVYIPQLRMSVYCDIKAEEEDVRRRYLGHAEQERVTLGNLRGAYSRKLVP